MRLTEKSQVTVPKAVRERLGIGPGSDVDFVAEGDGVRLVKLDDAARKRSAVEDWLRSASGSGNGRLTTEDIMDETRGPFDDLDLR
ncbi:AbrB/MazE/SpoVT family DNA-binding domain-containing protein [Aureimonas sp. AU4]|uniref:AbrB/MazE/SpoVT family DNA-binding domain-containing protein n=1 Tax=Aureimonas sp. AU4 TaxID=1638163 RepID=UPI0007831AB6|nr:AbrB/MazE/SpoVT family DNA-binding domain-containing protein [Aureimonas sp. AU4]